MDTQKVETRALSDDHLDAVAGGFPLPLRAFAKVGAGQADGQNDPPAQMFQQLMQQFTQG